MLTQFLLFASFSHVFGQDDELELQFGKITDTIWFEIEAGGYPQGKRVSEQNKVK